MNRVIYERIAANTALTFCTTLAALNFVGLQNQAVIAAITNAFLIAIIAGLKEYQAVLTGETKKPTTTSKVFSKLLIF